MAENVAKSTLEELRMIRKLLEELTALTLQNTPGGLVGTKEQYINRILNR